MGNEINLNPETIYRRLDELDGGLGTDNKGETFIRKSIWNEFADICGGKHINEQITKDDAMRSIKTYIQRATADTKKKIAQFLGLNNQNNNQSVSADKRTDRSLMPDNTIPNDEPARVATVGKSNIPPAAPLSNVSNTPQSSTSQTKRAKAIADSWAETFKISNRNGEFTKFVERLYEIAKELNITKTTSGTWDKSKYPTIEDQIVDELMAIFAGESRFRTKTSGIYHGIFQLANDPNIMADADTTKYLKEANLKYTNIKAFDNLSRLQQLEYLVPYLKTGIKRSNLKGQSISPAQVWSMIKYPSLGKPGNVIKNREGKVIETANHVIAQKTKSIEAKQNERDNTRGKLKFS